MRRAMSSDHLPLVPLENNERRTRAYLKRMDLMLAYQLERLHEDLKASTRGF
jgi:hypothetical protein